MGGSPVGDEALEPSNRHGFDRDACDARFFALDLLRTSPSADGRKQIVSFQNVEGTATVVNNGAEL